MKGQLFDLAGRTALVTGSSRGLGRAMAAGLAEAGAAVVLNGSDANRLAATGNAASGNTDPHADAIGNFAGGGFRRVEVQIDTDDMGAIFHQAMGDFFADAASGADHDSHLAGEFFLRRHAL